MKVEDIMTRDVIQVRPDTRVGEIARIFRQFQVSGVPVVTDDGDLVGIITELDLITRHARPQMPAFLPLLGVYVPLNREKYRESLRRITGVVAEDIMTTPVTTVSPDASIEDLATMMISNRANPLPVLDEEGRLLGIVSRTDVLQVFEDLEMAMEEVQQEEDS